LQQGFNVQYSPEYFVAVDDDDDDDDDDNDTLLLNTH
jgi:hypothetical protein